MFLRKSGLCLAFTVGILTPIKAGNVDVIPIFKKESRILFQGDSITDGLRGRDADPNHILGHGYVFIIAAKYGAAFPELKLDFMNRGISGNKVGDLAGRWTPDTLDLKPDILSILVGINDESAGIPLDAFEQTYDKILAEIRIANPRVQLVLCAPFTLPVGPKKENYDAWLAALTQRGAIVSKLAEKYGAAFVNLQPIFDAACQKAPAEYWIWDGIHPTYSGHQLMADEWIRVVRKFPFDTFR